MDYTSRKGGKVAHREPDEVCEEGRDSGEDEDGAEAACVRVACGALQVGRETRDERRGAPDLADHLHVVQSKRCEGENRV